MHRCHNINRKPIYAKINSCVQSKTVIQEKVITIKI